MSLRSRPLLSGIAGISLVLVGCAASSSSGGGGGAAGSSGAGNGAGAPSGGVTDDTGGTGGTSSGGTTHTGGTQSTGGRSTGGMQSTGGTSTGGTSTGGTSTGGTQNTGGSGTGGGSTGGSTSTGGMGNGTDCGGVVIPKGSGGPSGGTVGQWANVTPAGISLNNTDYSGDNFGAQDVLVDPARPSDFYAFFCHQGVYKSTDYGQTWKKVNTGTNGSTIDSGKPWGEAIDTNRCRDPNTPPTLYSLGSQSRFWRSTDGGVNWTGHDLPNDGKTRPQDGYDVDVDPYNGKHLIVGFHEESGLAESSDGGDTFRSVTLPGGMSSGASWYGFFIDTGDPATTRQTWLMITQATGGNVGTWRTTDGGSSWKQVSKNEHVHGGTQIFQYQGVVYMAGVYASEGWGVLRSTDFGGTWTHVGSATNQATVYGTPNYVYAQSAGATGGVVDESQTERAPQPGTSWSTWPQTMTNGPKHASVSYDGSHYIVVGGNWDAGVWRYVEP